MYPIEHIPSALVLTWIKTIVSMPTCGLMNDDRIFDHPDKFDPERWLGLESGKLLDYFLPFSTGPRACIGRK